MQRPVWIHVFGLYSIAASFEYMVAQHFVMAVSEDILYASLFLTDNVRNIRNIAILTCSCSYMMNN